MNQKQTNKTARLSPEFWQDVFAPVKPLPNIWQTPTVQKTQGLVELKIKRAARKLAYALPFRIAAKITYVGYDNITDMIKVLTDNDSFLFHAEGFPADEHIAYLCLQLG